ncbi:MAG: extracellular solute-binding protein [Paenibacillaceae bacterium]|nr:extracellular solute-binding protein [Paenibacillaceae bacterium]
MIEGVFNLFRSKRFQPDKTRAASAALCAVLAGTLVLSACSNKSATSPSASPAAGSPAAVAGKASYPLQTDTTLTYWVESNSTVLPIKSSNSDVPFFQELQKKTGVKLKFIQAPANQAKETINIMFASGDYADVMEFQFLSGYPGGPEKAIKDGNILKLNDAIDKYAPNLKKYLKEHPEVDKLVKTDSGSYYGFPFITSDPYLDVYQGPIFRKDWLDDLGLPVPTTIDEWYTTLKAFKEKKGAEAPLTFLGTPRSLEHLYNGAIIGAFGVNRTFYLDNGQVKFGPAQPGYKQFLETMRKWYAEGLLDKNIATVDSKILDAQMTSGKSGAAIGNAGGQVGKWLTTMKDKDPKYNLVGAPYPTLKKGDRAKFGQKDSAAPIGGYVAISPKSKNIETAVRMLDYGYSPEGAMFYNFGTEGVTYKMDNGYPKYTDLIMNNPDKYPIYTAMSLYIRGQTYGPYIQDKRYAEQYFAVKQQRDAIDAWKNTDNEKYALPPVTPSAEENAEYTKIMTEVNTLIDEYTLKVILGSDSLDNYDKFLEKLKALKVDRAVEIQAGAYKRFQTR